MKIGFAVPDAGSWATPENQVRVAQRAEELFKCSKPELRQKLLEYMLSNVELDDKKLKYIVNDPFRSLIRQKKKSRHMSEPFLWQGYSGISTRFARFENPRFSTDLQGKMI